MKHLFTLIPAVALFAVLAAPGHASSPADHGGHAAHASADAALVEGLVKKIDKAAGKLTLSHGPLPNGMPAMTMAFRVTDRAWLETFKEGQKVRFALDEGLVIVRIDALR